MNINNIDINAIANVITAIVTLGMFIIAWVALYIWRKEFIGKKKIELSAEIVSSVLEFQDILINARLTIHTTMEINKIEKWLNDVNNTKSNIPDSIKWPIHHDRLNYLTPLHRLNANADKIDDFGNVLNKSF